MNYNFLPYAQDQDYLLPPSLKEWVREDSLAQFISDAVDHLDAKGKLQRIYAAYRRGLYAGPPSQDRCECASRRTRIQSVGRSRVAPRHSMEIA
jgi:hypothetical protein